MNQHTTYVSSSQLSRHTFSHTEATVWEPGPYVDTRKIVYFIKERSTIMQYETNQLLFVRSPVGSIAVVLFSHSLTLLMPLPQIAWQHNYLCKKSKAKVNDGLKNTHLHK